MKGRINLRPLIVVAPLAGVLAFVAAMNVLQYRNAAQPPASLVQALAAPVASNCDGTTTMTGPLLAPTPDWKGTRVALVFRGNRYLSEPVEDPLQQSIVVRWKNLPCDVKAPTFEVQHTFGQAFEIRKGAK